MKLDVRKINQLDFPRNMRNNRVNAYLSEYLLNHGDFNTTFVKIEPNESTTAHAHFERENFIVISGEGQLIADNKTYSLKAGNSVYVPSFVSHSIVNTACKPLLVHSLYWEPKANEKDHNEQHKSIALACAFPTPNGVLHLGHLSGPFLAFDIVFRFLIRNQNKITSLLGFDTQQGEVYKMRCSEQSEYPKVNQLEAILSDITLGFKKAGIAYTDYADTRDEVYCEQVRLSIKKAIDNGIFIEKLFPTLYCKNCERYLTRTEFEAICPNCYRSLTSNECEDCAWHIANPHLLEPKCGYCNTVLSLEEMKQIVFPVSKYQHLLKSINPNSEFVKDFYKKIRPTTLCDLPVFHSSPFGITMQTEITQNRISCWVENIVRIEKLLEPFNEIEPIALVRFFGIDNAYLYAVLCPILTFIFFPERTIEHTFLVNYFYTLEHKKFSTSAKHAIWVNEFVTGDNSDALRLYFTLNRADKVRLNYSKIEFKRFHKEFFLNNLIYNIERLLGQIKTLPGNKKHAQSFDDCDEYQMLYQLGLYCYQNLETYNIKQYAQSLFIYNENLSKWLVDNRANGCLSIYILYFLLIIYEPLLPILIKRISNQLQINMSLQALHEWPKLLLLPNSDFTRFYHDVFKQKESINENRTIY